MRLSISNAIQLLMLGTADEQRLTFEAKVPTPATRRAMAELEQGKGKRFDSDEALFDDLASKRRPPVGSAVPPRL